MAVALHQALVPTTTPTVETAVLEQLLVWAVEPEVIATILLELLQDKMVVAVAEEEELRQLSLPAGWQDLARLVKDLEVAQPLTFLEAEAEALEQLDNPEPAVVLEWVVQECNLV